MTRWVSARTRGRKNHDLAVIFPAPGAEEPPIPGLGGWGMGPGRVALGGLGVGAGPDPTRPDLGLRCHDKRGLPAMWPQRSTGLTTREVSRFHDKQVFRLNDKTGLQVL